MSTERRTPAWADWALRISTACALGIGAFVFTSLDETVSGIEDKLDPLAAAIGDLNTQLRVDAENRKHRDKRINDLEAEIASIRGEQQRRSNRVNSVGDLERRVGSAETLIDKRTIVLRDLRRDIESAKDDRFRRRDFERWLLRFSRANPALEMPDLSD